CSNSCSLISQTIYILYLESLIINSLIHSFIFTDTATTAIYTLSLHDALPIFIFHLLAIGDIDCNFQTYQPAIRPTYGLVSALIPDRKSTRLNSSHVKKSYAVFCLKKKKIPK